MLVERIFQLSFGILMKQKIMSYHKIKITTFEEGKTYMYSISLKAKDENKFEVIFH